MPSAISHLLLLERAAAGAPADVREIIRDNPIHAAWGSVGPDYLFFHPKDWSSFGPAMEFIFQAQENLREVKRFFDEIDAMTGSAADFVTGGAYSSLKTTGNYLSATILTAAAAAISQTTDLFRLFESPQQKYQPLSEWWWMDVAHSYRSGRHLSALWEHASGSSRLQAYVLGYATHVAGDVVVHPFVNHVAGGGYRLHARRHVLVEKAFDTYVLKAQGMHISTCGWHKKMDFSSGGDPYPQLPDDVSNLMHNALSDSYADLAIRTGVPSPDEIKLMYRFYYTWLEGVTGPGMINLGPPPAFNPLNFPPEIKNILSRRPPALPGGLPQDEADWRALLLALFGFMKYAIEMFIALVSVGYQIIANLAAVPFKYFLWMLQRLLYETYRKFRLILSLGAYVHPANEDLSYFDGVTSGLGRYSEYPSPWESYRNSGQTYHLVHPATAPGAQKETPATHIFSKYRGPLVSSVGPVNFDDVFGPLFGSAPNGPYHDHLGICALGDMNGINTYVDQKRGFVSAERVSLELFDALKNKVALPNWNLDGDRGISWPAWRSNSPKPWTSATDFTLEC
ncbi:zinc dependent phospholipase C family protein [Hoeflea sp. 108]|jgi:hypothetical protein|uniref:zinc dependent phospholipase C family protein n=1 Tax=Hoeflea sp. 108 TaxID=1116369 RepID=UPI00039F7115|nr:zinc dependent phospholipase C family protein [Hoeflea sp. 108]